MSNFPNGYDDDSTLPAVNDNLTEIGDDAINAIRDAIFQIEQALGLNIAGTSGTLAARLGVFINPDGSPNASVLTSLGLVTLPITDNQIANNAGIPESKLHLDYRTGDLFNYIRDLSKDVNLALGWINVSGVKLEPHLIGAIYRHDLKQIDVSETAAEFLNNKFRALRDNTDAYTLINDINNELLAHQWADGSPFGVLQNIITNNGSTYASYYAHPSSGIFLNTSRFNNIPQTADNVQLFAEYIDTSSILLLGTRIQNLYSAGISRTSRSSSLITDGYGQAIIPPTAAIAYLKGIGNDSFPLDDINQGDDIIQFTPNLNDGYVFDEKFALVKVGDVIRINYGTIEVPYLIKEKKYNYNGGNKIFIVRIAGKNIQYTNAATARVDKPLFNNNKYGELSIAPVNNQFGATPSLVISNPRGAQALGLGFDPDQFDESHYMLYLALYPTGNPSDGYIFMPGIDITANRGATPGLYTLENVVQNTNNAFRTAGYNYRFSAFTYQGEYGICLADSYNNSAFSIVSVALALDGTIDSASTALNFPNNVVDIQPVVGDVAQDPLGFGPLGSGVASPPFYATYGSPAASQVPTRLFVPLRRNNYYVNGAESERLAIEPTQALDSFGDGYWVGTIQNVQTPFGRVEVTYRIPLDLSASQLKVGKTLVVQGLGAGSTIVDAGRFIIKDVSLSCAIDGFTDVTVYDAVHAFGFSPTITAPVGTQVALYFSADSVSFNAETATDYNNVTPFKRHFETYVDDTGFTFTHERGRINVSGGNVTVNTVPLYGYAQLSKMDLVKISPKLRGYQYGSVNKIALSIFNYTDSTGMFDGYLANYDGTSFTHTGPLTNGRKGEITRFYDETYTDYIDVMFDINTVVSDFTNQVIDVQLFPSLQLDDELFLLATCQLNDTSHQVSQIMDAREFGNTSEKDLSSSVFDLMSGPERYLHSNGVIRGFDIAQKFDGVKGLLDLSGGIALSDGRILNVNNESFFVPVVREFFGGSYYPINWILCVDSSGQYELIPMLDYDADLGTPNDPTRVPNFVDPVSAANYNLQGLTFSDLTNNRKDLVPLYVVAATVSISPSVSIALSYTDARRYVYRKDWGERPTVTAGTENGEFRSLGSLAEWLNRNSAFFNTVTVKGTFNDLPLTLSYNQSVRLVGDGTPSFNPTNALTIEGISLNNIAINQTAQSLTLQVVTADGCNITNTSNDPIALNNCIISNCTISTTTVTGFATINGTYNNVTFNFGAANNITINGGTFTNCTFNFNANSATFRVTNASFFGCFFNYGSLLSTNMVSGLFSGCKFLWLVPSIPMTINNQVTVIDNEFLAFGNSFTTYFLNFDNSIPTNGFVSRNFFYRTANTLTAYINVAASPGAGVVSFANNFFDSTTVDGSNQNLIANLPLSWPYVNNLNTPPTRVARLVSGPSYSVVYDDDVIALTLTSAMTINLPQISLSPPGRTLTIKDVNGTSDVYPITFHRASGLESFEGLATDYVWRAPFASITLVAVNNGWIIV